MYEQMRYLDMEPGATYHCPPGGMTVLCLSNIKYFDTGYVKFLVLEVGSQIGWHEGHVYEEQYTHWKFGSWRRLG